jgi:hypothetical protein
MLGAELQTPSRLAHRMDLGACNVREQDKSNKSYQQSAAVIPLLALVTALTPV